jgi:ankyrin repeat protein
VLHYGDEPFKLRCALSKAKSPATPKNYLKYVIIIGPRTNELGNIREHFAQESHIIIGDGKSSVLDADLKKLTGKIDGNTHFHILAHGIAQNKKHFIGLKLNSASPTENLFKTLRAILDKSPDTRGQPFKNIDIWSCYSGAIAQNDIKALGEDSVCVAHAASDTTSYTPLEGISPTKGFNPQWMPTDNKVFNDFMLGIIFDNPKTKTIARVVNGKIQKYTFRPAKTPIIDHNNLDIYLKNSLHKFYKEFLYKQAGKLVINQELMDLPPILPQHLKHYQQQDLIDAIIMKNYNKASVYIQARNHEGQPVIDINYIEPISSRSILYMTICDKKIPLLEMILDNGANINQPAKDGKSPLLKALELDHQEAIKLLIDKGADLDQPDDIGTTPLLSAIDQRNQKAITLLIDKGADLNKPDNKGTTPLLLALYLEDQAEINRLIDNGVDLDKADKKGVTPLLSAISRGNEEAANLLINKGANPNKADKQGNTPIHKAIRKGLFEIVRNLAEHGANLNEKPSGQTLSEIAVMEGYLKMGKFIANYRNQDTLIDLTNPHTVIWAEETMHLNRQVTPTTNTHTATKSPVCNIRHGMMQFHQNENHAKLLTQGETGNMERVIGAAGTMATGLINLAPQATTQVVQQAVSYDKTAYTAGLCASALMTVVACYLINESTKNTGVADRSYQESFRQKELAKKEQTAQKTQQKHNQRTDKHQQQFSQKIQKSNCKYR